MMAEVESQELSEVRAMAREFAQAELRPHVERWDHERAIDSALHGQLGQLGFFGMVVPERFGGMELDMTAVVAILEEIAAGEPAVALTLALQSHAALLLLEHGTDAQRNEWLERLAGGDALACMALAEDADSDPVRAAARAANVADGYRLSGTKRWVTNGAAAQLAFVLAQVDGATGLFLTDLDATGIERGPRDDTLGLRALPIITLALKDVPLAAATLLGGKADAVAQLQSTARFEQLAVAAIATGIAAAATEHATGYADVREQFGTALRTFEGIQFILAEMATRTAAARALLREAAKSDVAQHTAMAKLFCSETAMSVTTQAVQVYGGYGYMRDYPVEKLMRDAKGLEIIGGANEHMRVAIAESLYRD